MGRTGRPALIIGTATVLVAAVGTGVVLTRPAVPVARAATTLAAVRNAQIVAANGIAVPARDGQQVPNGDVVRTGGGGNAELLTRGRVVYLEDSAAVAVVNGAQQQLRTGAMVIDAQHGPGLRLDLAGDVVAVPDGSATEATRSVMVEVGSLAGPSEITSANARRLSVPPLAQAVINGEALPATTTPLHLTDSAAEAQAVPELVNDDRQLRTLAAGIDSTGGATTNVVETAWTGTTPTLPKSTPPSERVLPIVIADATSGGSAQDRYNHVVGWRQAGGSWGVVVELLSGHAGGVETELATLERGQPTGRIGTVSIQALGLPPAAGGRPRGKGSHQSSTPPSGPTSTPPSTGSGPPSGGGGPSPSPTPTTGPVRKVEGTVSGVVGTVLGLLPVKKLPKPAAHPSKTAGGLLGDLP